MSEAPDVVPRIMGEPTTAQLRQVMNAGRSTRTPSHAASSPQPRQRPRQNSRHQATPPHGPLDPSSRTRSQRTPPRTFGMPEPFGSGHSAHETRFGPAMRRRRCVRPTSAIHISKTSTQVPLGYDDNSSWTGDSRRAAHFARENLRRGRLFAEHNGGTAVTLTPPSPPVARRLPPRVRWPRPISPPPREERRLPRSETPSTIARLSTNQPVREPFPAPDPFNIVHQRQSPG